MKKVNKKKPKKNNGLVIKIDDNISIFADKDQYIVKMGSIHSFLGSLEHCFEEIFAKQVKIHLIENPKKDMETIVNIHKDVSKWLRSIFRGIENPKSPK